MESSKIYLEGVVTKAEKVYRCGGGFDNALVVSTHDETSPIWAIVITEENAQLGDTVKIVADVTTFRTKSDARGNSYRFCDADLCVAM